MPLAGLTAGTGGAQSALHIGDRGVGGPRGVVIIEALLSLDFMAEGEGTKEFSSPLESERGGTEITFSFSLMMG